MGTIKGEQEFAVTIWQSHTTRPRPSASRRSPAPPP